MRIYSIVVIFWGMQIIAQLLFKWGATDQENWMLGFVSGNLFGFSSIWFLMILYKELNPNVALGIATAGSFLLSQIALSYLFKSNINLMQWLGVVFIAAGVMMLSNMRLEME